MNELSERFEPAETGEGQAAEKIRCDACPVMCYIAEGRAGACDRYANIGGRIVRSDPITILHHAAEGGNGDLDHLEPYDEDGPPGQTHPDNLAPLCRRHHRCKTSGRWRYRRNSDGSCTWRSPSGRTYAVTSSGTFVLC